MARLLIVEDRADTAEILRAVLLKRFPGWIMDVVASVPEARRTLAEVRLPYGFAILDFRLPDEDRVVRGDLSLCTQIRHQSPSTRVIHITAYAKDPDLTRHLDYIYELDADSEHSISKDTTDWMERVVARIQNYLHSDRVEAKLDDLFPEAGHTMDARSHLRQGSVGGSVTNRLIDLCADARIHWPFLTTRLKDRMKRLLSVDESRLDDVRISLIGRGKPE